MAGEDIVGTPAAPAVIGRAGPEDGAALRVLQLVPSLDEGGVERGTVEIAAAIAAAGGQALVASRGGRLEPALRRAGGRLARLDPGPKNPLRLPAAVARLRALIREEGIRIVHARSRAPAWAGLLAARAEGVAFVTTYHGTYSEGLPFKRLYNSVMARGEPVIAVSEFIAAHVRRVHGVPPERLVTIPRGADLAVFDPAQATERRVVALAEGWAVAEEPRPILLCPARLTRWKGQAVLLEAVARLRAAGGPPVHLVLAGGDAEGPFAQELLRRAGALGLGPDLRMPGHVADMPAAYRLATLVLCPSVQPEAFGRTAAEAQAMERPVIASDLGGARETVAPGETGWLVPPGDPAALAQAIGAALALPPAARAAMGAAGRARVAARFSTAAMQRATLAVYARVLSAGS